ncbi:MAG: DUF6787 family protein [Bacteroidota bacterium]|nr:DUF6787 family protein [Bacteroidota bacterium]
MNWISKLEERWEVKGWWQITLIFIVFAITGSSSVFVGKYIMYYLGITPDTNPWIRIPVRIIMVFVVYQILLIWIGFLFGQFKFFWNFEQKMYKRIGSLFVGKKTKTT